MSTTSSSLLTLLTEPAINGGLLLLYNALIGGGVNQASMIDAAYLAGSNLVANTLVTLFFTPSSTLSTIFGTQANTTMIENAIITPLLTSIMYSYAYDKYYKSSYNLSTNRSTNMSYIISFIVTYISNVYSSSIYTLLTTKI